MNKDEIISPESKPAILRWFDFSLTKGCFVAVILVSGILVTHTLVQVLRFWSPVPCGDIVSQLLSMRAESGWFTTLWKPFNEHIIAFPRLFYSMDILLFGATGGFLVTMNILLSLATIFFLAYVFGKHMGLSRGEWAVYLCIVLILYLNGVHFFNLLYGFMIQHWLENLLMVGFAYVFARLATASTPSQGTKLALCLFPLSIGATFTSGAGIVCLPVALILGILLRINWKYLGYLALLLGAETLLYIQLNPHLGDPKPVSAFTNPWNSLKFFLAFFGAPFMRFHTWPITQSFWSFEPALAVFAGAFVLGAGMILCIRAWLDVRQRDALTIFLVFIFVFLVGTGLLCTNSRIALGIYEGTNKKYANTVILAWIAVFSLAVKQLFESRALIGGQRQLGLAVFFGVFLTLILPAQLREKKIWEDWHYQMCESEASLITGVYDVTHVWNCDWRPQEFFTMTQDYLRPRRWAVFGRYPFEMGDAFAAHFTVDGQYPCAGYFDFLKLLPSVPNLAEGFFVSGWAWDQQQNQPIQDIVLVNESGMIIGIAHSSRDRPDVRAVFPHPPGVRCGWVGFAKASPGEGSITAYAIMDQKGKAFCLGTKKLSGTPTPALSAAAENQ